ncbi:unnamed protein product, partial [Porites evermanni]
ELSSSPSTASTSQEDHAGHSESTSSRILRVTLLSSEWRSTKGGLSTINRELAIQLAKHPSVKVSVYLPQCSEEDKRVTASHNVQLIEAEEMQGYDPVDWLSFLPENHSVDCVIGHGAVLGRQVQGIKRQCKCKWIQVVHTAPEELGMYKSYTDAISKGEKKHQAEVKLCEKADQVVAVGPKLAEAFSGYLRACAKDQDVLNLTPGIFSEFSDVTQATEERRTFSVLVFGRGDNEDFQLKGYDIAACAIAELKDEPQPYKLLFVGAPSGEEEKVKDFLLQQGIDRSQLTVRCFNESREHLARLFCEVDLAIMPSRTEGFGLAALEALSAGLPVLVSGNSGLGEALQEVPNGSNCVVESEDPKDWANAIKAVRKKKRKLRLGEAKLLQGEYAKIYSWLDHCNRLVHRMLAISQGPSADEQNLCKKATVICRDEKPSPTEKHLYKGSTKKLQSSKKGKRTLSSSNIPAPKYPRLLEDEGPSESELHSSKKGPVICQDEKPSPSEKRHLKGVAKRSRFSKKGKRPLSSSVVLAQKQMSLLRDEGTEKSVVVKLLRAEYERRSKLMPLSWFNTIQLPLENVYTRLKIVSRRKTDFQVENVEVDMYDIFKAPGKGVLTPVEGSPSIFSAFENPYTELKNFQPRKFGIQVKNDEVDMYEIFKDLKKGEDVMTLVEGSPGIGKTTFCLKLAYDWARETVPTNSSFPKLQFVLLLKCRDIDKDIMEAIKEQLLPEDMKDETWTKFSEFIKDIHVQDKILLILDGLDELPEKSKQFVDKLLRRRILPFCYVLVTCRQEKGIDVRKNFEFDLLLEIKGFTEDDAYCYIKKHFQNVGPNHSSKGETLAKEVKENTLLNALRNNPLNLLLLCVIYEDYDGKLPTSRTELYQVIVQCLLRRYCAKHSLVVPEDNNTLKKRFDEDILALGELAWTCLLNDRQSFREEELAECEVKNKNLVARKIGLLYKEERLKRILRSQYEYWFLHKTFQEYLAASFIVHKLQKGELNVFQYTTFDDLVQKYPQVFVFVSGMLGEKATVLFTQIGVQLKEKKDWDWKKCSQEAATFFVESFSESGHAEQMPSVLCSYIPFPQQVNIELPRTEDNIFEVVKAFRNFRDLQPVKLIIRDSSWFRGFFGCLNYVAEYVQSCSQIQTLSIFAVTITSVLANAVHNGLIGNTTLSEFTLQVDGCIPYDAAVVISELLHARKVLKKVKFQLGRVRSEALASSIELALSGDALSRSVDLNIRGSLSDTAVHSLGKLLSDKALTSFSLNISGDVPELVAAVISKGIQQQTALKSLAFGVDGNLSLSGVNVLQTSLLENRSLNDLVLNVRGEIPDNWQFVVENVRSVKKGSVNCTFNPDPSSSVTCNQVAHFRPAVVEKGLETKQHLTVVLWGELKCDGADNLCEILVRVPLTSLTLKVHGNLSDGVANIIKRYIGQQNTLSSLTIDIWGELAPATGTLLQELSRSNETVQVKVHGVSGVPNEMCNALDVSINNPVSLTPVFSEVKNTRKERVNLKIINNDEVLSDWPRLLGDALAETTSLTTLDLTVRNY